MIYLDNSATSGRKPDSVINAVNSALKIYSANPGRAGHKRSLDTSVAVYNVRKKISDFFGADGAHTVMFCANCTHAINSVIKGVLNEDDHVIISDLEHNAVARPIKKQVREFSVAKVSFGDDNKTLESFKSLIRDNTKMIFCTAASNVTGRILPLKEIGKLCKEKGILFAVDAAQGGGIIPLDMQEMGIDYLCLAPHKGFFAPMATGVLIARKPIQKTLIEGGNGTDSLSLIQNPDFPEGFESGTLSVPNIIGIGAGLDFVKAKGMENIYKKEMRILGAFYDGLAEIKSVKLYTPKPRINEFVPVLSFNVSDKNSEEVAEILDKNGIAVRAGFHCSALAHKKLNTTDVGTVRISPSFSIMPNEISFCLRVLNKI